MSDEPVKFPDQLLVTYEADGDNVYFVAHEDMEEIDLDAGNARRTAIYKLVEEGDAIRRPSTVRFKSSKGAK